MREDIASVTEFSHVVGAIYDCAIDPRQWPNAIREVCQATNCAAGIIGAHDLNTLSALIREHWNYEPEWLEKIQICATELAGLWDGVADLHERPIDEPLTALRDIPQQFVQSRYYREWAEPLGFIDTIQMTPLRQPSRIGAFGVWRHKSLGQITERDLAIMRLLAPHIRRAVTISDVLNMQAIEAETLRASLDLFQAGIVLLDGETKIVHANRAAETMLKSGSPISSHRGELRTGSPQTSAALRTAVATAAANEAAVGKLGIGLPAPQADGSPALIHVLPLTGGNRGKRIALRASAALFVTSEMRTAIPAESLASLFGLTSAETRVLGSLLAGRTPAETARTMGTAMTTVRTHIAKVFEKTGTSRQSELMRLAAQFLPPVMHSSEGGLPTPKIRSTD
ncbi:helix-turn-helix transcriptional regulator [uncultured Bradyrhizobium sp.]|uniref:helix-turn-helix transcriptional regulator n=1 Tax=Bradyrhizobium sp. TaxID=376 RepID=UPI0026167E45|nr:helix-turn-helix transcriptional regulator [uncultured Bradyrhizobium sp.]